MRRRDRHERADAFESLSPLDVDAQIYGALDEALEGLDRQRSRVMPVPIWEFQIDPPIQVRTGGLDHDVVERYANILLAGGQFDDPVVAYTPDRQMPFILSDGFHRIEAHQRAYAALVERPGDYDAITDPEALLFVRTEVRFGDYAHAYENAESANMGHGKQLSLADRFNIFERRTIREHEWVTASNNAIARIMGVSHHAIRRWRERVLERNPDNRWAQLSAQGTLRVGMDGRTQDVGGLQQARARETDPTEIKRAKKVARRFEVLAEELEELAYPDEAREMREWLAAWKDRWNL